MSFMDLITEEDGKTICPVRCLGILGAGQFLVLTTLDFLHNKSFDIHGYGTGLASVIAALGIAFAAKSYQEGKTDGGQ